MDFDTIKTELENHGTQAGMSAAWVSLMPHIRALSPEDKRRITAVKDVWKAYLATPDDWTDRFMTDAKP